MRHLLSGAREVLQSIHPVQDREVGWVNVNQWREINMKSWVDVNPWMETYVVSVTDAACEDVDPGDLASSGEPGCMTSNGIKTSIWFVTGVETWISGNAGRMNGSANRSAGAMT